MKKNINIKTTFNYDSSEGIWSVSTFVYYLNLQITDTYKFLYIIGRIWIQNLSVITFKSH